MKIGIEWPETFFVESRDLQIPWKVIHFVADRLSMRSRCVLSCIEYIQGKFENSDTLVFKVVIVQPAECKFSVRREVSYMHCARPLSIREEGRSFSEEDVKMAGEGLVELIAQVLDQISRHVKDMSYALGTVAEQARRADAISEK